MSVSKQFAEVMVRQLQDDGHAVVVVYYAGKRRQEIENNIRSLIWEHKERFPDVRMDEITSDLQYLALESEPASGNIDEIVKRMDALDCKILEVADTIHESNNTSRHNYAMLERVTDAVHAFISSFEN